MRELANWFYLTGSLCFLVGTLLVMLAGRRQPPAVSPMPTVYSCCPDCDPAEQVGC